MSACKYVSNTCKETILPFRIPKEKHNRNPKLKNFYVLIRHNYQLLIHFHTNYLRRWTATVISIQRGPAPLLSWPLKQKVTRVHFLNAPQPKAHLNYSHALLNGEVDKKSENVAYFNPPPQPCFTPPGPG